jgi:RNA polymerase sigma-70 factor (ECF subfamily)
MATSPLEGILGYLRALGGPTSGEGPSDAELLERFVARRDEAAFAALLTRHGPLVLGVCRQVLRDSHDAEDAFQATFLVLARRAASIRKTEALAAWLHRVAFNLAQTARTSAAVRRGHERQAGAMSRVNDSAGPGPTDWQPLLHDEVNRLPEKYRAPVVLCYLGGKSNEEAAGELGWPVGSVKGRLSRARQMLRSRLERRGLAPSAVVGLLSRGAVRPAVPAGLADSTLRAAVLFAAGQSAGGASAAVVLAERALRTAALKKLTAAALVLGLVAAIGAGAGLLAWPAQPDEPPADPPGAEVVRQPEAPPAAPVGERIVFLGDSSTDGNTYLLLLRQALARAGKPVPGCINAGVSTDTARGARQRLQRDVFGHKPTLVVFGTGVHDAIRNVAPADYEADVRAIAAGARDRGVALVLMTSGLLGPKFAGAEGRLAEYNAILHRLAGELDCRLADANRLMRQARAAGRAVVEGDNVHPNFEGQRLIARAVLDALGHRDVPVPRELSPGLLPGVVREWHLRIAPAGQTPLSERLVAGLGPQGAAWTKWALPERGPARTWWLEQERQRGFALSLKEGLGEAKETKVYQGIAYLHSDRARQAILHTGGHLVSAWLNGQRVYKNRDWTGWHAGKERLPVRLRAGRNVLVIECGAEFFLSVSDDAELPQDKPLPWPARPG